MPGEWCESHSYQVAQTAANLKFVEGKGEYHESVCDLYVLV